MVNILLVEDEKAVALGVIYALEDEGFKVFHGKNLIESRKIIDNNKIDIILLDIMLRDENGYDLCKEIRSKGNNEVAIIFMTACDEESNVVMGLDIGGDDYIIKPIRLKELVSRINAVLRRRGHVIKSEEINNNEMKIYKSGNLTIETYRYKVFKDKIELNLTLSEYRLMVILIENYPNTVTRDILLEKIWDIDGNFVDANTLNVYVKRLREKIELDVKKPKFIETIRGVGYRWNNEVEK